MRDALIVRAHMAGAIVGDAPHLDALLESVLAIHHAKPVAGAKIDRSTPLPEHGIPIPMLRQNVAGQAVPCCSAPIIDEVWHDRVEYVNKRLDVALSEHLDEAERKKVDVASGTLKSYRLPQRLRNVNYVSWFCCGDRREILKALRRVKYIGKKTAHGNGEIAEWTVDRVDHQSWWYADSPDGQLLMRPLPVIAVPDNVIGKRKDFCAVSSPYWHPDRYVEAYAPC